MHLSWTQIRMLMKCPKQYEHRYVNGIIKPPGIALVRGSATHKSIELNMRNKLETGELLPRSDVEDIARDAVIDKIEKDGLRLIGDEKTIGKKVVKGQLIDEAVNLSDTHAVECAPLIAPVAVESEGELQTGIRPIRYRIDIETEKGIKETKTGARTPPKDRADLDDQLTMYSLVYYSRHKKMPEDLSMDFLLLPSTKLGYRALTQETSRTRAQLESFLLRVETAVKLLDSGVFMPTDRSNWWCSPKWCGYYEDCPYVKE